jgi:hypothetical protein
MRHRDHNFCFNQKTNPKKMKINNRFLRYTLIQIGVMGFFLAPAAGQTLATYDFATNGVATNVATDLTASNAAWNGFSSDTGFGGTQQSAFVRGDQLSGSFDAGQYLSFTLTAAPGSLLNLQSFTFDFGGSRLSGTASYTVNAVLRTDAELIPFSTDVVLNPGNVTTATSTFDSTTPIYTTLTADLSGSNYQGLDEITFNLYVFRTSTSTSNVYLRVDSFDLQGAVIPEPALAGLALAGIAMLLCVYRRLSKKNPS